MASHRYHSSPAILHSQGFASAFADLPISINVIASRAWHCHRKNYELEEGQQPPKLRFETPQ